MGFSEWRKTTLGSVLSLYNGARRPEEKGEIPVYGGNGILAYSNDFNTDGENIIIGRVGAYCGNVNYVNGRCWVSDNAILAKVVSGNNSKYMYYRLVYQDLHNLRIGSSQPLLTQSIIKKTEIKLPPLEEQKAIANILSTLDEKIEVNNRINKTLEEMAQAIFKHWFVDFEFPNENGEPYKSSGGEMVESELGMIPKKWEIVEIGELCKAQIGGDWGKDERFINSVPAVCLRGTDLQKLKELGFSREAPIRWVKKNSIEKRRISELDILIGGSGLGPVGRSLCYSNNFERLYDYPITYSNFCKRIRAINRPMAIYLEQIIEGLHKTNEIKHYVNGTSVPNLDIKGLLKHKIIKPDNEVIEAFSVIKENYFNYKYSKENLILSQIRNTLLPKLMSGEIRVPIKSGSEIS